MIPPPGCQDGDHARGGAYVYLLRSLNQQSYYVGWTTDLPRRLAEHNSGQTRYTHTRGPWKVMAYESYMNREAAKRRERQLKRNPRMLALFKKRATNVFRSRPSAGLSQVVG